MNPEKFLQKEKENLEENNSAENGGTKEAMSDDMKRVVNECLARATNVSKAPLKIGSKPECLAWDIGRLKMGKVRG